MTYALTNAFQIRDILKNDGAIWDKDSKSWIVTDALYAKLCARSPAWCNNWHRMWSAVVAERIGDDAAGLAAAAIKTASGT